MAEKRLHVTQVTPRSLSSSVAAVCRTGWAEMIDTRARSRRNARARRTTLIDNEHRIVAKAYGSPTPEKKKGESVVNGDFLIVRHRDRTLTTGDGINEETSWTFDFGEEENYRSFEASTGPLTAALLTLTLTPKDPDGGIESDVDLIETLGLVNAPEIQKLPFEVTKTITTELLNHPTYLHFHCHPWDFL